MSGGDTNHGKDHQGHVKEERHCVPAADLQGHRPHPAGPGTGECDLEDGVERP